MIASRREAAFLKEYEHVKSLVNILTNDDTDKKIVEKLRGKNVVALLDGVLTKNRRTRDSKKLIGALIRSIEFERSRSLDEEKKSWPFQFLSSFDCANVLKAFRQPTPQVYEFSRMSRKPFPLNNHLVSCKSGKNTNKTRRRSLVSSSKKRNNQNQKRKKIGTVKTVKLCEVTSEMIFLKPQQLNQMHPCKILSHTGFTVAQTSSSTQTSENSADANELAEQLESIRRTLASKTAVQENFNFKPDESDLGFIDQLRAEPTSSKFLKIFGQVPTSFSYGFLSSNSSPKAEDDDDGFSVKTRDRSCETEDRWCEYKMISANFWPNAEEREPPKFNILPEIVVTCTDATNTREDSNFHKETDDIIETSTDSLPNNIDIGICLKAAADLRPKTFIEERFDAHTSTNVFSNDSRETVLEKAKYSTEEMTDSTPNDKKIKSLFRLITQHATKKSNKFKPTTNELKLNENPFSKRKRSSVGCQLM